MESRRFTTADTARLRVAIDASAVRSGTTGVGRYVSALLSHGASAGIDYRPVTNAVPGAPHLRLRPTLAWLQAVVPLVGAIERWPLAHFPTGRAPWRLTCPFVLTVHDLSVLDMPELYSAGELRLTAPWLRASIRRATLVIAVSNFTAEAVRRRFPGSRVTVVPEAPSRALRPDARPGDVLARWDLGPRIWLAVGSLVPRKNYVRLIEAFGSIRTAAGDPPPQLVIVGPRGPAAGAVVAAAGRGAPDAVRWLGPVDDAALAGLYAGAELLALPSLVEGFGLPACEALAAGTPVVASSRGALPDVAGPGALYVDPDSVASIADGLLRLGTDPALRRTTADAGARHIARLDWAATTLATADAYREAVRLHSARAGH